MIASTLPAPPRWSQVVDFEHALQTWRAGSGASVVSAPRRPRLGGVTCSRSIRGAITVGAPREVRNNTANSRGDYLEAFATSSIPTAAAMRAFRAPALQCFLFMAGVGASICSPYGIQAGPIDGLKSMPG